MLTKRDYLLGTAAGTLTSILLFLSTLILTGSVPPLIVLAVFVIPLFYLGGLWFGERLGVYLHPTLTEFSKFAAVGLTSTLVDFVVLNLMSRLTGVTAGLVLGWINLPGFFLAGVNAYLWNKLWVFAVASEHSHSLGDIFLSRQPIIFFGVIAVGALINSTAVVILTTYLEPGNIHSILWLNISKALATSVSMVWNFVGYKYIVFSKTRSSPK